MGACEGLLITGWVGSRVLPPFALRHCLFVFQTKGVSELGQQLAACPPLITLELAMCRSSEHPPPEDFEEISACRGGGGGGRGDWKW